MPEAGTRIQCLFSACMGFMGGDLRAAQRPAAAEANDEGRPEDPGFLHGNKRCNGVPLMTFLHVHPDQVYTHVDAPSATFLRQGWLLLLAITLLYAPVLAYLFYDWSNNSDYSHGFFIPPIAAFFLWRKRNVLRSLPA